jgi:hypothetical protein
VGAPCSPQPEPTREVEAGRGCAGFEESLVLAVRSCFGEPELRGVLILRRGVGRDSGVGYFSRLCSGAPTHQRAVCLPCDSWFRHLATGLVGVVVEVVEVVEEGDGVEAAVEGEDDNSVKPWPPDPQTKRSRRKRAGKESLKKHKKLDNEDEEEDDWSEEEEVEKIDGGGYQCEVPGCCRVFGKKRVLLKHVYLVHEGGNEKRKRRKVCEHCGALITANNMKQHVRTVHTHKDEKNFACEHCGKEFKYRSELTVHLTHHTGELNFTCSACARKFRRAAEARLCEKGHKGVFNFQCSSCEYRTHKKHHLDRHLQSHLKATPFSCPICGFRSGRKDNLKQHVEKRHCGGETSIQGLEGRYPHMYRRGEGGQGRGDKAGEERLSLSEASQKPQEERGPRPAYSVEERLLDQRSVERLQLERQQEGGGPLFLSA